jgi:hypothetical protein
MTVPILGKRLTKKVRFWTCNNCGHEEPATDRLKEILFAWLGPQTSTVSCPNCKSRTFQQAYDDSFTSGYFLVIKTYNKIRGKDNGRNSGTKTPIRYRET